jgi:hypothetical protein
MPSAAVSADEGALIGTWRLKSFVREVSGTGERFDEMGAHPDGYLGYATDGRMYVIMVADGRVKPREAVPSDAERAQLYESMVAYAGTYTVEGNKVVHHVDISWSAAWGGDQVRFFTLQGDTLTIKSAPTKSWNDGREGVGILVWEKVK